MEKATQFVHGTPKLAASHRTYRLLQQRVHTDRRDDVLIGNAKPFVHGTSVIIL